MSITAALQIASPYLLPLAGLTFLGGQQKEDDFTGNYKNNTYGGIYYGPSQTSNPFNFQDLLNFGKKDTFTEDFMQGKDTSGLLEMDPEAIQDLKDQATLFNKDGDYIGGVLPYGSDSLVGNKPETEFLGGEVKKTELLNADGNPITNTSSTTSSTTSPNNNKNNDNKDGNNFNKLLYGSLLINPLFEGGKYLFNQAKNIFGKDDTDEDDGKTDFEKMTGITYEKAMELQRKRENELINRRALEGGFKDAGKYMYLAGAAGMEAGKNIGRNTQDMLRSMAYGQSALANTIAGAAKTTPLARTYFS